MGLFHHHEKSGTPGSQDDRPEFIAGKERSMDRAAMIEKLNEILKWEYAGLIQYTQYSFLVRGTWREVYYKLFRDSGEEALEHAHKVGDKIAALGGVTTVERGEVKVTTDLNEMLRNSLEMERRHVELYTQAVALCEDRDVGLRNLLEDICQMEQDGADHLSKILDEGDLSVGTSARPQQRTG
jgi:bacterioferritin (cytochrome b1)